MECYSKLERICDVLREAALNGNALLRNLGRPRGGIPIPGFVHTPCLNLSAAYAAVDTELRVLFREQPQIDADASLQAKLDAFHQCSETMQLLMSFLTTAFKLYKEYGDYSGMASWQTEFCKVYPEILYTTEALHEIMLGLLREYERSLPQTGGEGDYVIEPGDEVYIGPEETVRFCPRCTRRIPSSSLRCPYCAYIMSW